jgi:hypothetical protein
MDPIEVIVADVARRTLIDCARGIVRELAELLDDTWKSEERAAAEAVATDCLSVLLQVRASADFGAISAKSLRQFGRALGEFTGYRSVQGQLLRPYRDDACDAASMAAELDRLWRAKQESLRLPQLPAGYWAQALAEYCAAANKAVLGNPQLQWVRGMIAPRRRAVLPAALDLLEQHNSGDTKPPRSRK